MHICAYTVIADPFLGQLPIFECIESLYDHVDSFVVLDISKYDDVDLSKYGKVRRHVHTLFNPFDNPFGSAFTHALRLAQSDTVMFLDADEIFEFKSRNLKDIVKLYPLEQGAGIAFSLRNYFCNRNTLLDGCSSKGAHVFRNRDNLFHDLLAGYWQPLSPLRKVNFEPDKNDGVRLVDGQGQPLAHYPPIPLDEVVIHHTSHLSPLAKMVRSVMQFNHTSTIDLPGFFPYDMRLHPFAVARIYEEGQKRIEDKSLPLYGTPIPFDYEPCLLLDKFIERVGYKEFDTAGFSVES